jgi:ADP-L-glycero-D-manno-heptose 6-epimerase
MPPSCQCNYLPNEKIPCRREEMTDGFGHLKIAGQVVVTGSAGFIGSQIANCINCDKLLLVDKLELFTKHNYSPKLVKTAKFVEADGTFLRDLPTLKDISWIIHMGAISNTSERDLNALKKWNVDYTKSLWNYCTENRVNFIYASSAATYGDGKLGFEDDESKIPLLKPLNPYGQSKNEFDIWALEQIKNKSHPPNWYGLKFFNVYGPNENHKDRMASSIWHGLNEIKTTGSMTLFKSHNPKYKDGDQARDFIFIDDILQITHFLLSKKPQSQIYNCGTGHAGTFLQVANGLFSALGKKEKINWIDTPLEFRAGYQYLTEAIMEKLKCAGYNTKPTSLDEGISKYLSRL